MASQDWLTKTMATQVYHSIASQDWLDWLANTIQDWLTKTMASQDYGKPRYWLAKPRLWLAKTMESLDYG